MSQEPKILPPSPELPWRVRSFITQENANPASPEEFNRLALELFAFQFQRVPIYRQFCEGRNVAPGAVTDWSQIPALPVSAFKEHIVSSLPESERVRVFHSSGTTGQTPSRHFHGAASLMVYEASLLRWFEAHFSGGGATFIFLTPPAAAAPHSSLIHMFEVVRQKFGRADSFYAGQLAEDGSWTLDFAQLGFAAHQAELEKRPLAFLGTAFSFVHWLDHLAETKQSFRLPAGSRLMETGGYKGRSRVVAKADLRRFITKYLGVRESNIVTEYGMSELGSQAYDAVVGTARPAGRIFRFPPWARAQVVSPETGGAAAAGETGLLRVFDLANIHSVMAIQTEDLAVAREDGFELLGRAESAEPRGCSLMATS